MRLENAVAANVLERVLSAYGFTMQKELSDKLGIAKSNVASWLQRGQVPGNVLVQCALDTGVDVQWLVNGEFANANNLQAAPCSHKTGLTGQHLIQKMLSSGGKAVLRRILQAYGFTTQKQLSEYLGISTGTISTWIRREYFPGDVVITCVLDTGVSLLWLATGSNDQHLHSHDKNGFSLIPRKKLNSGMLQDDNYWCIDLGFIPHEFVKPVFIYNNMRSWVVDMSGFDISNGKWLLGVDNKYDIYEVLVLPNKKISVTSNGNSFICDKDEVQPIGKVILSMEYDFK